MLLEEIHAKFNGIYLIYIHTVYTMNILYMVWLPHHIMRRCLAPKPNKKGEALLRFLVLYWHHPIHSRFYLPLISLRSPATRTACLRVCH